MVTFREDDEIGRFDEFEYRKSFLHNIPDTYIFSPTDNSEMGYLYLLEKRANSQC